MGQTIDQMRTPLSPAYTILDQTPTTIERPSSVQALSTNIQSAFANGKFKPGIGLELTPFWMMLKKNYTITEYLSADPKGRKDYGKLLLQHLSFSAATSSSDTFSVGSITPGLGISYGVRALIWPGNISKRTLAKIEAINTTVKGNSYLNVELENVLSDIESEDEQTLNAERLKSILSNRLHVEFSKSEEDILREIDKRGSSAFEKNKGYCYDFVNEYIKTKLPLFVKDAVALSKELSSAREGFMWEVATAGLTVFQENKFSKSYFAKAQVWTTLSYRILSDDENLKKSVDIMMLFRGTFNDRSIDSSHYFDIAGKIQWNNNSWDLSVEGAMRFATRPTTIPDVNGKIPKNYTYRLVANFNYKINNVIGLNVSFGKSFDGISTEFDKKKEQSILASGGLNVGIGKLNTK